LFVAKILPFVRLYTILFLPVNGYLNRTITTQINEMKKVHTFNLMLQNYLSKKSTSFNAPNNINMFTCIKKRYNKLKVQRYTEK